MKVFIKLSLLLGLPLVGCSGAGPSLEILATSPGVLSASDDDADDLTITVGYFDPDGDLGRGSARIVDCRADGLVTLLPIPRIAAEEAIKRGIAISGEMALVVSDIGIIQPSPVLAAECVELGVAPISADAPVFCLTLADAAGHASDGACTAPVLLEP